MFSVTLEVPPAQYAQHGICLGLAVRTPEPVKRALEGIMEKVHRPNSPGADNKCHKHLDVFLIARVEASDVDSTVVNLDPNQHASF